MSSTLKGFVLSALLHVGLLSWAIAISHQAVKPKTAERIVLSVNMFQGKVVPAAAPKALAPPPKEKTIRKKNPKPELAAPKMVALKSDSKPLPKVAPKAVIAEPEPPNEPIKVVEKKAKVIPTPKVVRLKTALKPQRVKSTKPKLLKKTNVTKKRIKKKAPILKAKKRLIKKPPPRKTKRIAKKPPRRIIQKPQRPPQKHRVTKTAAHAQNQPKRRAPPRKQVIRAKTQHKTKKVQKVGGVPYQNKQLKHPKTAAIAIKKQNIGATRKAPPRAASAQSAKLKAQYKTRLAHFISSKKRYPRRAKKRRQQGRVMVSFWITNRGIVNNIRIIKSAGSSLDAATISVIKKASGKFIFPAGIIEKSINLTITLNYELNRRR